MLSDVVQRQSYAKYILPFICTSIHLSFLRFEFVFFFPFQLNLASLIKNTMVEFFDTIENEHFSYPETMNTRELIHLYDYQKFILKKNFRFLEHFVTIKVEQYLSRNCTRHRIERPSKFILPLCLFESFFFFFNLNSLFLFFH